MNILEDGFCFKFGDGSTSVWYGEWLSKIPLSKQLPYIAIHDILLSIKDIYEHGKWNFDCLYTQLPTDVKTSMQSLNPKLVEGVKDTWVWSHNTSGVYTTKTAYDWLNYCNEQQHDVNWSWLWKLKIPANIQFFLWQFCHSSIPTRDTLVRRNILHNAGCVRCNSETETLHHCFFHCQFVKHIWLACFGTNFTFPTLDFNPLEWLHQSVMQHGVMCVVVLWKCWCARNKLVFEGELIPYHVVVSQVWAMYHDILKAYSHIPKEKMNHSSGQLVSRTPPDMGWVALNVDGSALTNPGQAGYGGLLRDHTGKFLGGFYGSMGIPDIMHAELLALLHGLSLCWDMGHRKVVCYTDSLNTLKLLKDANANFHKYGNDIAEIRSLLQRRWIVKIHHVFREANFSADFLAKLGANSNSCLVTVDVPPTNMQQHLNADALGFVFVRP